MTKIHATKCKACNGERFVGPRLDNCRNCKGEGFTKLDGTPVPVGDVLHAFHGKFVEIVIDGVKLEPGTSYKPTA